MYYYFKKQQQQKKIATTKICHKRSHVSGRQKMRGRGNHDLLALIQHLSH